MSELPTAFGSRCGASQSGATTAWAINANGVVVGGASRLYTPNTPHALPEGVTQASTWEGLSGPANLGSQCSDTTGVPGYSEAFAVNGAGTVGGTAAECPGLINGAPEEDAWLGTPSNVIAAGSTSTPSGHGDAITISANDKGQALVYYDGAGTNNPPSAELFSGGALKPLPVVPIIVFDGSSAAGTQNALNDSGVVVGIDSANKPAYSAGAGPAVELTPADKLTNGAASGIDANGDVVGISAAADGSGGVATIWPAAAPPAKPSAAAGIDLNTLIPAGMGIRLSTATAINANGQILAGGTINGVPGWFELTCGASRSAQAAARATARIAQAAKTPCDLDVTAQALENPVPTGLTDQTGVVGFIGRDGNIDPFPDGSFNDQCLSGCTNIAVHVKDSNGKAVPGSTVTATIASLTDGTAKIEPTNAGSGIVCPYGTLALGLTSFIFGDCGPSVGAKTDSQGVVRFRYFFPAAVSTEDVPLSPRATLSISAEGGQCSCTKTATGLAKPPLTVDLRPKPYVDKDAGVSADELAGLQALIGKNADVFKNVKTKTKSLLKLLESAKLVSADALKQFKTVTGIVESAQVQELLRRTPELIELDWFMAKFHIAEDGLVTGTGDLSTYGRELSDQLVPMLAGKIVKSRLFDFIKTRIQAALTNASKQLLGQSWFDQVDAVVKQLLTRAKSPGPAGTMTLKLFDVSRCRKGRSSDGACTAQTNGLFMLFSVTPHGQSEFYESPNPFGYDPELWLRAQCKPGFGCTNPTP